jgi:hypothetical protein
VLEVVRDEYPGHASGPDLMFQDVPITEDCLKPGDGIGQS